jgi:hypothetical protein
MTSTTVAAGRTDDDEAARVQRDPDNAALDEEFPLVGSVLAARRVNMTTTADTTFPGRKFMR